MEQGASEPSDTLPVGFRDPGGRLYLSRDRALRGVSSEFAESLRRFSASSVAKQLVEEGLAVAISPADPSNLPRDLRCEWADFFEHPLLPFLNYPYEWSPRMLHSAGELTLELAQRVHSAGYGLKDATPSNVVFEGPHPRFVDWLSFEPRDPLDPIWLPYGQFVRNFVLPLLAHRSMGWDYRATLLTSRDGLEPEKLLHGLTLWKRLRSPALQLATLPALLSKWASPLAYQTRQSGSPEQATYVLGSVFRGLRKHLALVRPVERQTVWTDYTVGGCTYQQDQLELKERFVASALQKSRPADVLDIGCNTGRFSEIALRSGARAVVSIDTDEAVIDKLWEKSRAENLNILPLVVDLARPTPATGWRNQEGKLFLDRIHQRFDAVLMLAVVHHLCVTDRIPLAEVFELAAHATRADLVIEFIGRDDPMFQVLLRGRQHLHADWKPETFEKAAEVRFQLVERLALPESDRILYHLRRKL